MSEPTIEQGSTAPTNAVMAELRRLRNNARRPPAAHPADTPVIGKGQFEEPLPEHMVGVIRERTMRRPTVGERATFMVAALGVNSAPANSRKTAQGVNPTPWTPPPVEPDPDALGYPHPDEVGHGQDEVTE